MFPKEIPSPSPSIDASLATNVPVAVKLSPSVDIPPSINAPMSIDAPISMNVDRPSRPQSIDVDVLRQSDAEIEPIQAKVVPIQAHVVPIHEEFRTRAQSESQINESIPSTTSQKSLSRFFEEMLEADPILNAKLDGVENHTELRNRLINELPL